MEDDEVVETPKNNAGRTTAIVAVVCLALGGAGGFFGATAMGGGEDGGAAPTGETGSPVTVDLGEFEASAGQIEGRDAVACTVGTDGCDQVIAIGIEQCLVSECSWRDDSHNVAINRTLACCRVTNLLADGD